MKEDWKDRMFRKQSERLADDAQPKGSSAQDYFVYEMELISKQPTANVRIEDIKDGGWFG